MPALSHSVLALNGYVRLVGISNRRPSNELLPRYQAALDAARRPDEKKKVISGVQNIKTLEAAKFLEALMADASLREEACHGAVNIAKGELARRDAGIGALATLQKVLATTQNEKLKGEGAG